MREGEAIRTSLGDDRACTFCFGVALSTSKVGPGWIGYRALVGVDIAGDIGEEGSGDAGHGAYLELDEKGGDVEAHAT